MEVNVPSYCMFFEYFVLLVRADTFMYLGVLNESEAGCLCSVSVCTCRYVPCFMLENITTEPHAQDISADALRVWLSGYILQQCMYECMIICMYL